MSRYNGATITTTNRSNILQKKSFTITTNVLLTSLSADVQLYTDLHYLYSAFMIDKDFRKGFRKRIPANFGNPAEQHT